MHGRLHQRPRYPRSTLQPQIPPRVHRSLAPQRFRHMPTLVSSLYPREFPAVLHSIADPFLPSAASTSATPPTLTKTTAQSVQSSHHTTTAPSPQRQKTTPQARKSPPLSAVAAAACPPTSTKRSTSVACGTRRPKSASTRYGACAPPTGPVLGSRSARRATTRRQGIG